MLRDPASDRFIVLLHRRVKVKEILAICLVQGIIVDISYLYYG